MNVLGRSLRAAFLAAPVLAVLGLAVAKAPTGPVLASAAEDATVGDAPSYEGAVAPNGRFGAFTSDASDLGVGASGGLANIWFRDMRGGPAELLSTGTGGGQANSDSYYPSLSNNGRYVVYESYADDIVGGETNGYCNVYLLDRRTGSVTRLSESMNGGGGDWDSYVYGASISGNGRWCVLYSAALDLVDVPTGEFYQVYLYDRVAGTLALVSRNAAGDAANDNCYDPSISANGRFVVYYSYADNLTEGLGVSNGNVFLFDARTGTTRVVTRSVTGGEPAGGGSYDPVVSNNGRTVAYYSFAGNLVEGDGNAVSDVFITDMSRGTTVRISNGLLGAEADLHSYSPGLSSSGRVLVFYSRASNLVEDDGNAMGDCFLRNAKTGELKRLTVTASGEEGNGDSYFFAPSLSSNGKWLLVTSTSDNFAAGDDNETYDDFLVPVK